MKDFERGDNLSFLDDETLTPDELAWDHAMDISGSVYARLNELGLSKKQLADRLGVTAGRVSQILKGYPGMSLKMLAKLEAALDFRLDSGFLYMPARGGATATAEIPSPACKRIGWADGLCEISANESAPLFHAVKGGMFAA